MFKENGRFLSMGVLLQELHSWDVVNTVKMEKERRDTTRWSSTLLLMGSSNQ